MYLNMSSGKRPPRSHNRHQLSSYSRSHYRENLVIVVESDDENGSVVENLGFPRALKETDLGQRTLKEKIDILEKWLVKAQLEFSLKIGDLKEFHGRVKAMTSIAYTENVVASFAEEDKALRELAKELYNNAWVHRLMLMNFYLEAGISTSPNDFEWMDAETHKIQTPIVDILDSLSYENVSDSDMEIEEVSDKDFEDVSDMELEDDSDDMSQRSGTNAIADVDEVAVVPNGTSHEEVGTAIHTSIVLQDGGEALPSGREIVYADFERESSSPLDAQPEISLNLEKALLSPQPSEDNEEEQVCPRGFFEEAGLLGVPMLFMTLGHEPKFFQKFSVKAICQGQDVIVQYKKKSGKTTAAIIALLEKINRGMGIQFLILSTTPKKAIETHNLIHDIGSNMQTRVPISTLITSVQEASTMSFGHILVGTPQNIMELFKSNIPQIKRKLQGARIRTIVYDGMDYMLEEKMSPYILQIHYHYINGNTQVVITGRKFSSEQLKEVKVFTRPASLKIFTSESPTGIKEPNEDEEGETTFATAATPNSNDQFNQFVIFGEEFKIARLVKMVETFLASPLSYIFCGTGESFPIIDELRRLGIPCSLFDKNDDSIPVFSTALVLEEQYFEECKPFFRYLASIVVNTTCPQAKSAYVDRARLVDLEIGDQNLDPKMVTFTKEGERQLIQTFKRAFSHYNIQEVVY